MNWSGRWWDVWWYFLDPKWGAHFFHPFESNKKSQWVVWVFSLVKFEGWKYCGRFFFWLKKRAYKLDSNNSSRVYGHVLYVNLSRPTFTLFGFYCLCLLFMEVETLKELSKPQIFSFFFGLRHSKCFESYATEPFAIPIPIFSQQQPPVAAKLGRISPFHMENQSSLHPRGRKEFDEVHFFFWGGRGLM